MSAGPESVNNYLRTLFTSWKWKIIVVYRSWWLFYLKLKRKEIFSSTFHRRGRFNWTFACILIYSYWKLFESNAKAREERNGDCTFEGDGEWRIRKLSGSGESRRKYENEKKKTKTVSRSTQHREIHLRLRFNEGVFLFLSLLLLICYFFHFCLYSQQDLESCELYANRVL